MGASGKRSEICVIVVRERPRYALRRCDRTPRVPGDTNFQRKFHFLNFLPSATVGTHKSLVTYLFIFLFHTIIYSDFHFMPSIYRLVLDGTTRSGGEALRWPVPALFTSRLPRFLSVWECKRLQDVAPTVDSIEKHKSVPIFMAATVLSHPRRRESWFKRTRLDFCQVFEELI